MPALISAVDQIDAAWLQAVFSDAGREIPEIGDLCIEPIGNGNTGHTVKVNINYAVEAGESAPSSVVCKLHPSAPEVFEATRQYGVFITEAGVLKLLAKGIDASVPELYFVDVNEKSGEFNLVCEDLSSFCDLGDQIIGCSIQEAKATVVELAKLHRQFWNEPQLNDLAWVKPRMAIPENAPEILRERFAGLLSEEQNEIVEQGANLVAKWMRRRPSNYTLIHSDCRVDNVLFDNRDQNNPKAYLIDFALANVGDAAADIAYFATSSLTPVDRLACEMDLLKIHVQEIAKKDTGYTFEKAVEAYRENIVSSLYLTLFSSLNLPDTPGTRQLLSKLFERNCAAVQHWAL